MVEQNPYRAPKSDVQSVATGDYAEVGMFKTSGRIGRVRYLAYNMGMYFLMYVAILIFSVVVQLFVAADGAAPAAGPMQGFVGLVFILLYLALMVYLIIYTVRRLHDMDASGWFSLLFIIPVVNVIFGIVLLFAPGTASSNRYGPAPPENGSAVVFAAIGGFFLGIAMLGIIAAIAIPAYQDYQQRAQQTQLDVIEDRGLGLE